MDYEKLYKEALSRAKKLKENPRAIFFEEKNIHVSDYLFPELRESEDEMIRKEIISALKFANDDGVYDKHLAWLEKQGEHEDVDIEAALKEEYKKGWNKALEQLPKEVDSQIWQIANNSAKTWEQSFAILRATQKAFEKGKAEGLREQKPAWNEEDEEYLQDAINYFNINDALQHSEKDVIRWLKSLKERIGG